MTVISVAVMRLTGMFDAGEIIDGIQRRVGNAGAWLYYIFRGNTFVALPLDVKRGEGKEDEQREAEKVEDSSSKGEKRGEGGCITRSIYSLME